MFDSLVNTPFKLSSTEILLSAASTICLLNLSKAGRKEGILSEICEPPQYGFTASASYEKCGPKFLRITDIRGGYVDWDSVPFCTCDYPHKYELNAGDVLVARSGSVGKSFIVSEVPEGAIFASYMIRLRCSAGLLPSYLYWCFQSQQFWHQIMNVRRGSAMKNINGRMLSSLRFPIPSKTEQYAQSQFLSAFQEKLQGKNISLPKLPDSFGNTKRIVEKIQELTSKIEEARGLRRKAKEEAEALILSGLKHILKYRNNWKIMTISACSTMNTGTTPPSGRSDYYEGDLQWYTPGDLGYDPKLGRSSRTVSDRAITENKVRIFEPGTVLLVAIGSSLGKVGLAHERCSSNQQITGIKFFSDILPEYGFWWMRSLYNELRTAASQATLPIINQRRIGEFKIALPPFSEQHRIVAYLDHLKEKIDNLKRLQHETQSELDALTPSLLAKAFQGDL